METDQKSVCVKNVDYSSDPKELQEHFQICGKIHRVTIMCNKRTGQPLGYAYIEFEEKDAAEQAIALMNDSLFKGRQLTVEHKRKNIPGLKIHRSRPRGFR